MLNLCFISILGTNIRKRHIEIYFLYFQETGFDISCNLLFASTCYSIFITDMHLFFFPFDAQRKKSALTVYTGTENHYVITPV